MSDVSSKTEDTRRVAWWQALLLTAGLFLLSNAVVLALAILLPDTTVGRALAYLGGSVAVLGGSFLFITLKKQSVKTLLGQPVTNYILLIPLIYIAYIFASRVAQEAVGLLPGVNIHQVQDFGFGEVVGAGMVVVFFALVVMPPLAEELLFRGLLYKSLRSRFGFLIAAPIVSLLFGIVHGQWNVAADTFVLSLFAVYLVEKSKSLWPAIALHFMKNLVAFVLVFVFKLP